VSGHRWTTAFGVVVAALVVAFVVSQCTGAAMPSAWQAADVTVVDAGRRPVATATSAPNPTPQPSTPSTSTTPVVTTTTLVFTTTTVVIDSATAGPAEAGVAAPVRGEQIQLTEPVPAPATTTTTTEIVPTPTTRPPVPSVPKPSGPTPPQPTPTQPPAPPPASTSADAITLTNQERVKAGLPPLNANGALNNAAAAHSADQAARNQMTHTGSNGSNAGDRIRAAGYEPSSWGENVAAGFTSAPSVVAGWMGSSGHRANVLNPAFTQIGVASATAADGTRYWTMDLAG
jgi:uncharacterized protein YkwD